MASTTTLFIGCFLLSAVSARRLAVVTGEKNKGQFDDSGFTTGALGDGSFQCFVDPENTVVSHDNCQNPAATGTILTTSLGQSSRDDAMTAARAWQRALDQESQLSENEPPSPVTPTGTGHDQRPINTNLLRGIRWRMSLRIPVYYYAWRYFR